MVYKVDKICDVARVDIDIVFCKYINMQIILHGETSTI